MGVSVRRLRYLFGTLLGAVLGTGLATAPVRAGAEEVLRIYLDADRTGNLASAESIELGVRTAIDVAGGDLEGMRLEVVPLDHRGNARRSWLHMQKYLEDERALAIFGGIHSPPYLTYRDEINRSGILLLLPWSAAGPITRTDEPLNWIYRLSVDDTKAGGFITDFAVRVAGCKGPAMLLLNSGWGRSNFANMSEALARLGLTEPKAFWFDSGTSESEMRMLVRDLLATGADCVLMVNNSDGGAKAVRALAAAPTPPRVFSHWGISGGDFTDATTAAEREAVDLRLIQTCSPFSRPFRPVVSQALEAASRIAGRQVSPDTLDAPVGFVHGFDLGLILIAALEETGPDGDIVSLRRKIRDRLENLTTPVEGLLRTYRAPFGPTGFDAHEALGADALCMARFDRDGRIVFAASN